VRTRVVATHAARLAGAERELLAARDALQAERVARARLQSETAVERGEAAADRVRAELRGRPVAVKTRFYGPGTPLECTVLIASKISKIAQIDSEIYTVWHLRLSWSAQGPSAARSPRAPTGWRRREQR
jgi:hypothetical protein